jgi:hypothetical protein
MRAGREPRAKEKLHATQQSAKRFSVEHQKGGVELIDAAFCLRQLT